MVNDEKKIGWRAHFCMTNDAKTTLKNMADRFGNYTQEKLNEVKREIEEQKASSTPIQRSMIETFEKDLKTAQRIKEALAEVEVCKPTEAFRFI